jgi:sugar phosphate permease
MKEDLNYKYPFFVWLASVLIAPIFLVLVFVFVGFKRKELHEVVNILVAITIVGVLVSIPAILITQIAFKYLARRTESQIGLKLLFAFFSAALIWGIIYIVDFPLFNNGNVIIATSYSLSIVLSSMLFSVRSKKRKTADQ